MILVPLSEAKTYLRVDSSDEDTLIDVLLTSAKQICADVARLDSDKWSIVSGESENTDTYTDEELERIQDVMKVAILYTLGYLYEHREEADHHDLVMTLRNLLFAIREGVF
ncbi:MAG: head-tail connector protein [Oscillospiraceae bacterium]|nr:head-tail connector protein [Oscillospiraceae bacterium]